MITGPMAPVFFLHLYTAAITYPYTRTSRSSPPFLTSGKSASGLSSPLTMQHAPSLMSFRNSSEGAGLKDFLHGHVSSGIAIHGLPTWYSDP